MSASKSLTCSDFLKTLFWGHVCSQCRFSSPSYHEQMEVCASQSWLQLQSKGERESENLNEDNFQSTYLHFKHHCKLNNTTEIQWKPPIVIRLVPGQIDHHKHLNTVNECMTQNFDWTFLRYGQYHIAHLLALMLSRVLTRTYRHTQCHRTHV